MHSLPSVAQEVAHTGTHTDRLSHTRTGNLGCHLRPDLLLFGKKTRALCGNADTFLEKMPQGPVT